MSVPILFGANDSFDAAAIDAIMCEGIVFGTWLLLTSPKVVGHAIDVLQTIVLYHMKSVPASEKVTLRELTVVRQGGRIAPPTPLPSRRTSVVCRR